jgi:hypothetical protein
MIDIITHSHRGVIKSKGGVRRENFPKQSLENNVYFHRKEGVK